MHGDWHLDGNALGGLLIDVFGREMTEALGGCAGCGAVNAMGALIVFRGGPGDVARCPACSTVVLVVSGLRDGPRAYLVALSWVQPSG
jgi:hypothetical protein